MNDITYNQIEVFLSLARTQNISKTARELYLSQPSVSKELKKLEDTLGFSVFTRYNRGLRINDNGIRLYAELDPIYNYYRSELDRILSSHAALDNTSNQLRVACFHDLDVMRYVSYFKNQAAANERDLSISCEYHTNTNILSKLLSDQLDIGFTFSSTVNNLHDFGCMVLSYINHYFILPKQWNYQNDGDLSFLNKKKLIIESTSNAKASMLAICRAHDVFPQVQFVNSYLFFAPLIARGEGFCIGGCNIPGLERFTSEIDVVPLPRPEANNYIQLVAIWKLGNKNPTLTKALSILQQCKDQLHCLLPDSSYTAESSWFHLSDQNLKSTQGT